jgi:hypothetical protein
MKVLTAGLALLLALGGAAAAAEDCSGGPDERLACLQTRQEKLQDQLETLKKQIGTLLEKSEGREQQPPEKTKAAAVSTAAPPPGWIEDERGCKVWNANPGPDETITWTGPCRRGIADGEGALIWYWSGSPHGTFVGTLRGGHYHRGVQVWSTGNRFDGSYRNDRAEGRGTYRLVSGEIYSGLWTNGCFRDGPRRAAIGVPVDACMK